MGWDKIKYPYTGKTLTRVNTVYSLRYLRGSLEWMGPREVSCVHRERGWRTAGKKQRDEGVERQTEHVLYISQLWVSRNIYIWWLSLLCASLLWTSNLFTFLCCLCCMNCLPNAQFCRGVREGNYHFSFWPSLSLRIPVYIQYTGLPLSQCGKRERERGEILFLIFGIDK